MDPTKLSLIIRDRENIIYDGEVWALSSNSDKGVFDILPQHTNLIALIKESITIHTLDGKTQKIPITQGVIKVYLNKIYVYLGVMSDTRETP